MTTVDYFTPPITHLSGEHTVTGSCHLMRENGLEIMIDCGTPYLSSLGLQVIAEDTTNKGRVDMTIILPDKVYAIEFKVGQAGAALTQIKERGYHGKYLTGNQEIYIIGINFDSKEKNITEFDWDKILLDTPPNCLFCTSTSPPR
jgi:hypothetical protein